MSSPEKKRQTEPSTTNPPLPDDFLLSCLSRISRLYYPTLSLVSKRFRTLLASPELYKDRSLLSHTENRLYVCFRFYSHPRWYTRWYNLCRRTTRTIIIDPSKKKKNKSANYTGYILHKVRVPSSPRAQFSGLVAVGSNIYNLVNGSTSVKILDCTSHTWQTAPSLPVQLLSLSTSVVDGKICVAGRSSYKDGDFDSLMNTFEVFDTKTQTWDPKPIPCSLTEFKTFQSKSVSIDGKFHVVTGTEVVSYSSKEARWDLVGPGMTRMSECMTTCSYCEINNVLYSASPGGFRWYDTKVNMWKLLKVWIGHGKFSRGSCIRLADNGGKMAVFWEEDLIPGGGDGKKIWCAEISLNRCTDGLMWGNVEWYDHVLTVPNSQHLVKVLAVTV